MPGTSTMTTVLSNTFDPYNRVIEQTDSQGNGISIAWQYPSAGITTVTDALSEETAYYFDEYARTIFIDYPGDGDTAFSYNAIGVSICWISPWLITMIRSASVIASS